ncbi:hypothetical protein B0H19DRAFT_1200991 [Mycena capillaripes]|nr:hypothetical protein B0H19DRAFT_1200991 [Mycena capillaripes]
MLRTLRAPPRRMTLVVLLRLEQRLALRLAESLSTIGTAELPSHDVPHEQPQPDDDANARIRELERTYTKPRLSFSVRKHAFAMLSPPHHLARRPITSAGGWRKHVRLVNRHFNQRLPPRSRLDAFTGGEGRKS